MTIELILFGFIVGISLGLSGGGGSIFALPLLVYGVGIPVHEALVISLIVVGLTSLTGAIQRIYRSEVDFRATVVMVITSLVFAPCGAYISQNLSSRTLMTAFAFLMFIVGIYMWFKSNRDEGKSSSEKENPKHPLVLVIGGAVTSFLNGLFGIGGGFLVVPTLVFAASLNIRRAMATSLLVIACVSFVSTFAHLLDKNTFHVSTTLIFLLGGIIGISIGIGVSKRVKDHHLHRGFAMMIVIVGILVLIEEFGVAIGKS